MNSIVTHHRSDHNWNEEWFFSTDHCQPGLSDDWVPITTYHKSREEVRELNNRSCVIGAASKEIQNPNPAYQA